MTAEHTAWDLEDPWGLMHPEGPLVDDDSAAALDEAIVELTLRRAPGGLGDGLADLHAMVSLLGQLHAWMPIAVAAARAQHHSWGEIAGQLRVGQDAARRRFATRAGRSEHP